jgi:hypothetical protein
LQKIHRFWLQIAGTLLLLAADSQMVIGQPPQHVLSGNAFPSSIQFSPLPSKEEPGHAADTIELQHKVVEGLMAHGFSSIWFRSFSGSQAKDLVKFAQSRGMKVDFMTNGFELFNRYDPPPVSVYSEKYPAEVKKQMTTGLTQLKEIDNVDYVFPFQDEPFHAGPESFDYSADARRVFQKRYGYAMPDSLGAVRNNPKKWLDLLNFQSNTFHDGWLQVYKMVKEFDPRPKIAMTHDSHNSFGAGVNSNSKVAIDDVFHWGGDFADVYVYDIYPYHTFDYRYGELGKLPKPRISQMHYAISQLRNLTTAYKKELGFWVGTYNEAWFTRFRGPEREKQYWAEREMAYTAIAQGSNYLISPSNYSGSNLPIDASHWKDYGQSMEVIQKAGPGLLKAPKVKANACFLFPRTQYLLLQEEYFNVGLSFELFLRAFGELDILHEDQVTDEGLNGYKVLVLADVKLLPADVASHIKEFVEKGGIVIADCVPQMDAFGQPLNSMRQLFGVRKAATNRIIQEGQWVPFTTLPPKMSFPPPIDQKNPEVRTAIVDGHAFGKSFRFKAVSPRVPEVKAGNVLLRTKSGKAVVIRNTLGKGKAYLIGFCLQDTYFQTFKDTSETAREQLRNLISCALQDAKARSHIYSSNPDIEATIRANANEGYLFIINHESNEPGTKVRFAGLGFQVGKMIDIETGKPVAFRSINGVGEFAISVPFGSTRLLKLLPN